MGRYVRDPWAKKSRKGMKTLGKMAKIGGTLGAAAYNEIKETNAQAQARQSDSSDIPLSGCLVMTGLVIAVIVLMTVSSLTMKILIGSGVLLLTFMVAYFVRKAEGELNENKTTSTAAIAEVSPLTSDGKVVTIKEKIVQMAPIDVIDDVLQQSTSTDGQREAMKQALPVALGEIAQMSEMPLGMEGYIDSLMAKYSISSNDISNQSSYLEYVKALIVQDILNGVTPRRISIDASPINFQAGEVIIWPFNDVVCYEEVTKRATVGASRGISIRIARGVYYRVGAFKGEPLITSGLQPKYGGSLILTNMNVYFYSTSKSIKFPYNKVLAFVPFEDGIGIQPDRANAKTIYFKCLDGRFAFNIVSNINNLS